MTTRRHWVPAAARVGRGNEFVFEPPTPEPWMLEGLCGQVDWGLFFPEKGGSTREAKGICQACDVRDECLGYAQAHNIRDGIWGGMSDRERRFLQATGQARQPKVRELDAVMAERDARVSGLVEAGMTRAAIAAELQLTKAQVDSSRQRALKRSVA